MSNEHYFSEIPSGDFVSREIDVTIAGRDYTVETAGGIFSPEHVDQGTGILLDTVPSPALSGNLLDLGCGWGPIALSLALQAPEATVWAVDVNSRALELATANAARLGITTINAVTPADVPADLTFDTIWSNPPIRIGKEALHQLLLTWIPRLSESGEAWLVVSKNLGADSLQRWMAEQFPDLSIERVTTAKSFRVIRVAR